jgi:Alw26I/Eco31I/Esp3I family type II restriction m6 adenine DNA methyltransferase
MREYDKWIARFYPKSQPKKKFAGWGTNLSRVGLETSLRLSRKGGIVGIVLPASILADDQSVALRKHLISDHSLLDIAFYPAEAKLYGSADIASVTAVVRTEGIPSKSVPLFTHISGKAKDEKSVIELDLRMLQKTDFVLPVSFGANAMGILGALADRFPRWLDLEMNGDCCLWAGREIDETGISRWLQPKSDELPLFIKGRMIERYAVRELPTQRIFRAGWNVPSSADHARIAWRDVSRPNQKRRLIATLIPPGWVAGNSLGVAYFKNCDQTALMSLLGVMNSTTFEFQLRAHLATGHVSLSSLRKVAVPSVEILRNDHFLAELVMSILKGDASAAVVVDAYVAKNVYQLSEYEYSTVLKLFCKVPQKERVQLLEAYSSLRDETPQVKSRNSHISSIYFEKQTLFRIESPNLNTSYNNDYTMFPAQQLTSECACKRTRRVVS